MLTSAETLPPVVIIDGGMPDESNLRLGLRLRPIPNPTLFLSDEHQLDKYLHDGGLASTSPRPGLILYNLRGRLRDSAQWIRSLKGDTSTRRIPLIIFTDHETPEDIALAYELGVNSLVTRPQTPESAAELIGTISWYWFEVSRIPYPA